MLPILITSFADLAEEVSQCEGMSPKCHVSGFLLLHSSRYLLCAQSIFGKLSVKPGICHQEGKK